MGKNNHRQVGFGHNKGRLQTGIFKQASFQWDKTHQCICKRSTFDKRRNRKFVAKKCHRNCSFQSNAQRFLQYVVSSSQKERGIKTSHKSETPQQVSPEATFQNGHHSKSIKLGREGRLGNFGRFKRRISPFVCVQKPSQVPEISISGQGLSISDTLFWSNDSSKNVCQNNVGGSSLFTENGSSDGKLHRRLAVAKSNKNCLARKQRSNAQSPLPSRFSSEQEKVSVVTCSVNSLHRESVQTSRRSCVSFDRTLRENKVSSDRNFVRQDHCKALHDSSRNDCILFGIDSKCKTVHETNSVPFVTELEPNPFASNIQNCNYTTASASFKLVVRQSEHCQGQIFNQTGLFGNSDHRCKWQMGMGRSHEQSDMSRAVVTRRKDAAHKLSRVESSSVKFTAVSDSGSESERIDQVRQHDCVSIHQSPRGHKIDPIVQVDKAGLGLCSEAQRKSEGGSHSGKQKCIGGCFKSSDSQTDGVVLEQFSTVGDFQVVGTTLNRSICNDREQEDSTVLLLDSSSASLCIGCPINCMAEHVCVCVPTSTVDSQGVESFSELSVQNDPDCPDVAETALVSTGVEISDSLPIETPVHSSVTNSMQGEDIPSKPRVTSSDCMVIIDRKYAATGFSEKTRQLLSKSWRTGTQKDYRCKFRQFHSWCDKREIDTYSATLVDCAEFITSLFEKGLKYRTINGYRSMLSSVLAPVENIPVGQHPYIIRLLRGIFNERPPVRKLIPEWDLLVVLGCLKEAPFEPLKDAPLKYLTWKTCFLLAITTFRRCGDLQSLQLGEGLVNVQKQGVTFLRTGLSKTDRPNHQSRNIFVPHLPNDRKLDPKRSLTYYLKKTEEFRKSGGNDIVKLLLAVNKPHKPVSTTTISRWLVDLIKFCYKKMNKTVGRIRGHSTRSIGPSWALFKGASLQQVMEAADWSRETTFTRHYLKPVNIDFFNV